MTGTPRPFSADHPSQRLLPPQAPFDVVVLGAGRVGTSYARALESAGHTIVAELHRNDDPSPIATASVVVVAVPDSALKEAAGFVARLAHPGTVVLHTCGLEGLAPLDDCGPLIAAIHPASPVARPGQPLEGITFGVTCPDDLRDWCDGFVRDLGGVARFVTEEERPRYHAALSMASNFAVALAGDAADILGGHDALVPLLRATVENIASLGPDDALTGPVVRGDAGTVRAHLRALPAHLIEVYVVCARRALARATASGRLDAVNAKAIEDALAEAMIAR